MFFIKDTERNFSIAKTDRLKFAGNIILSGIIAMTAISCGGNSMPPGDAPEGWIGSYDRLRVDNLGLLRNTFENEVVLRGVNLGGWLFHEAWMGPFSGSSGGDGGWAMSDTISALDSRFGETERTALINSYEENFITEEDFMWFKEEGINCLRIPFWYRNFMSNDTGAWLGDNGRQPVTNNPGFLRLDWVIDQAKQRGIYVILDLHGAPGGQSSNHSTGTLNRNQLWTSSQYEQATVELWKSIAMRYKNQAAVAAYDLLNEPMNGGAWQPGSPRAVFETVRVYDRLYREIRAIDSETIIMMEAIWHMPNLPNPNIVYSGTPVTPGNLSGSGEIGNHNSASAPQWGGKKAAWHNVIYSMHLYDRSNGSLDWQINNLVSARNNWKVGIHAGEFENGDIQVYAYNKMNENKISWNKWTYKIAGRNLGAWSLIQKAGHPSVDIQNSSIDDIRAAFGAGLRTFNPGTTKLASGWSLQTADGKWLPAFRTAMKHAISGVFTNSNQKGFPAGGWLNP